MSSDLDCVQACADTYTLPPTLPVPATGVNCRVKVIDDNGVGAVIVAFRGSVTPEDWARDFFFAPVGTRADPQFGLCHAGFLDAAQSIVDAVEAEIGTPAKSFPVYMAGHSLGGAIAVGVGALLKARGQPPAAIVTFGCPRFGMAEFAAFMASVPMRQYVRGDDIVPDVPEHVWPLCPFVDTRDPRVAVGAIPIIPPAARFDIAGQLRRGELEIEAALGCHSIAGYVPDVGAYLLAKAA